MGKDYRATDEQWKWIEDAAAGYSIAGCIAELRARIEALEAAQQPTPAGGLVERVADVIYKNGPWRSRHDEARAAIREVAEWLRSELTSRVAADLLDQEANQ